MAKTLGDAWGSQWEQKMLAGVAARKARVDVRIKWYGDQVAKGINLTMRQRMMVAVQLLRDKTVVNLSRPVRKVRRPSKRRVWRERQSQHGIGYTLKKRTLTVVDPASRSKPGEFPRADTTRLMRDIFWEMHDGGAPTARWIEAIVGTTLKYGLVLETRRNRSFLVRTLNEMWPTLRNMLMQRMVP